MKVGTSGHQTIRPESASEWVKTVLRDELRNQHASTGVSCLAAGTDQIFAAIVLELGLDLEAVIPCVSYATAFGDSESKARYAEFNGRAVRHHHLDYQEPSEEAFLRAGQRVVDICDSMLFVWDGRPAGGPGGTGGTADIVAYARTKAVPFVRLNPLDRAIERSNCL